MKYDTAKKNERTTTSHGSTDECHKHDAEQKVARYKRVHVIFIYVHSYKEQKQVELIYGEVKTAIILERVSTGMRFWEWGKCSVS